MAEYNRRDFARRGRYAAPSVDAKIVVMGNTGVGKTSLLHRYTQNKFDPKNTTSTTGAFFVTKKIDMNGTKVRLQLWDTAGQERFRSMAPMYYRGAHAALVLYDITNLDSFQAARGWLEELKRNCDPDLLIYLVGSKADLTHARQVKEDIVRHSLSTWFPPPQPPAPPVAPTISTFGYIRPRFTSLTSLTSIRSSTSSPDTSDTVFETVSSANNASRPPRQRVDSTGGLMRSNTASPPRGRVESPVPLGRSQSIAASAIMSPSRFGRLAESTAHAGWSELVEDGSQPTSSDSTAVSDGYEWGLGPDMKLYEVSAKDGDGIPKLFNTLIGAIISKRDAIEAEQALKRRDSVMLSSNTPAWAIQADQEAAAEKARSGWSCCGG